MPRLIIISIAIVITSAIAEGSGSPSSPILAEASSRVEPLPFGYKVLVDSDPSLESEDAYSSAYRRASEILAALVSEDTRYIDHPNDLLRAVLADPSVATTENLLAVERPYGTLVQLRMEIQIPRDVISALRSHVKSVSAHRKWFQTIGILAFPVVAFVALKIFTLVDRKTLGYRRLEITVCMLVSCFAATCAVICLLRH